MPGVTSPCFDAAMSRAAALRAMSDAFAAAGIETPQVDARRLLAAALGVDAMELLLRPDEPIGSTAVAVSEAARRRLTREPVSRILGWRDFYGRQFRITPDTLDPRPDSETIIEAALAVIDEEGWRERPLNILDVGTGSGCLLLTLLAELPNAIGTGSDISAPTLEAAAVNAEALGLQARARFTPARSLRGIEETFDLLLSNPPYVPRAEIPALAPEVALFEPRGALDGGPDGLSVYRELAEEFARVVPDGWALFEVGAGQACDVAALMSRSQTGAQPQLCRFWRDLGGHQRVVARRTRFGGR